MSYQDLQINLTGRDVSASDSLRALARAANQAAKSAGDSLESMNRQVRQSSQNSVAGVKASFGGELASWAKTGLAGILAGVAASVTSSVTGAVSDASTAILSQLKSSVIDYNSLLENANIGFTTMLGSGSKATAFINELQDFAQKTPFETGNLIQLSQQMMGYGIAARDVIPYLTALGDGAAAAGRTGGDGLNNIVLAFEQMHARGRVDLQDINQLTQGGIPALKILAAQYGTTTSGVLAMIHTGKLLASEALPLLISGIERGTSSTARLGGMMTKQSQTFQGAMSNINDALDRTLSTGFLPLFRIVERGAISLQRFATSKAVQQWASSTGAAVEGFATKVGTAL